MSDANNIVTLNNSIHYVNPNFPDITPEQYNRCIQYFWDVVVHTRIFELSTEDKNQFFQMVNKFSPLMQQLFLPKGEPITNYVIYGNEFYEGLKDNHEGIDFTPSWIVNEYKHWLTTNGLPFPEDMVVKENIDITPMLQWQANNTTSKT